MGAIAGRLKAHSEAGGLGSPRKSPQWHGLPAPAVSGSGVARKALTGSPGEVRTGEAAADARERDFRAGAVATLSEDGELSCSNGGDRLQVSSYRSSPNAASHTGR